MKEALTEALGWTLIHSLWQALLLYGIVALLLRMIPSRHSSARYGVALGSLAAMLFCSGITFSLLYYTDAPQPGATVTSYSQYVPDVNTGETLGLWADTISLVGANMHLILAGWIAGTLLFSLRLAGGVWYVATLRRESYPIGTAWQDRLQHLIQQLGITRAVTLAASARLQAPVVLGYIKPIILVPAGMLAGLSAGQVETILLHELAHIRRHDYIVNIAQMLVEALFFFNPCIWAISAMVRAEREHCCDDAVVRYGGNAKAYATALVQLEEARLQQAGVALSLANNKHQLLTRIKRLMEKSAQQNPGRERLIPALLLVVGLVCASWMTFAHTAPEAPAQEEKTTTYVTATADTTIRNKKKNYARYERSATVTTGEDGKPHEVITETYEGDENMRPLVAMPEPPEPAEPIEPMEPSIGFMLHTLDMLPSMEMMLAPMPPMVAEDFSFSFDFNTDDDSIPAPGKRVRFESSADAEARQEAFKAKFKEQFADFYATHQQEVDKMLKEVETETVQFKATFHKDFSSDMMMAHEEAMRHHKEAMHDQQRVMEDMRRDAGRHKEELIIFHSLGEADVQSRQESEDLRKAHEEVAKAREKEREILEKERGIREKERQEHAEKMKEYDIELKKQLIKDKYIKEGDNINIHGGPDGLTINGKKIREKDAAAYKKLREKYME